MGQIFYLVFWNRTFLAPTPAVPEDGWLLLFTPDTHLPPLPVSVLSDTGLCLPWAQLYSILVELS